MKYKVLDVLFYESGNIKLQLLNLETGEITLSQYIIGDYFKFGDLPKIGSFIN